jgi:Mlc titration factor MtfA (ptsG expression regulator)
VRREFELQVQDFLAERRISGVETPVTEEVKVLVAASATIVGAGWAGFRWGQVTEVLLNPQAFNADDYGFATADPAGQAHLWGVVILSIPALLVSFDRPVEGSHVGVHEFAHVLDLESGDFDECRSASAVTAFAPGSDCARAKRGASGAATRNSGLTRSRTAWNSSR